MADADVLFRTHREGVFRYLCRVVGQTEAARDLTQEVFLRVTRAGVPVTDEAGRRAWLFRIARNLALNHMRDSRRRGDVAVHADRSEPAVQELSAAIRQALASLSDMDRDVFLLRETAGLEYAEIGEACDLTVEAVRSRLKRARAELRTMLEGPMQLRRSRPIRFGGGES